MLEIALPLKAWPELELVGKAEVEDVPKRIHELRRRHLCEGSYSPAASILSQLAKGKKDNQMHGSPSNIHWSDDEQTIYYWGQPVELGKVRTICQCLTGELQAMLQELTFGGGVDRESTRESIGESIEESIGRLGRATARAQSQVLARRPIREPLQELTSSAEWPMPMGHFFSYTNIAGR